jgi:hypothetical protein
MEDLLMLVEARTCQTLVQFLHLGELQDLPLVIQLLSGAGWTQIKWSKNIQNQKISQDITSANCSFKLWWNAVGLSKATNSFVPVGDGLLP